MAKTTKKKTLTKKSTAKATTKADDSPCTGKN